MSLAETATFAAQCPVPSVGVVNTFVSLLVQSLLQAQCDIAHSDFFPPDYASEALANGLDNFDFVVIGAGTAGSVLASRLSENPEWNVLVLEAGGDPPMESEVPALSATLQHTDYMYNYYVEPNERSCKGFRNNRCYWPRGKGIGGSGSANTMMYFTGTVPDYDSWLENGNLGWGSEDVWPYFEKSTRPQGNETHPQGYVKVGDFNRADEDLYQLIYEAAKESGQLILQQFDTHNTVGYATIKGTVHNGHRTSSGKGHLTRVSQRPNLKVIKNAQVTKLNFDANCKRVQSIDFELNHKYKLTVSVKREAIVSAGSVDTPKVLMLSGIGPQQVLKSLNIPVIHNLPVGMNLQDHVIAALFVKYDGESMDQKLLLDSIYQYLIHRKGPLSTLGILGLGGFIQFGPNNTTNPDLQILHVSFRRGDSSSMFTFLQGITFKDELRDFLADTVQHQAVLAIFVVLLHPKSRGTIKLKTSSFREAPIIDANYFADKHDSEMLVEGLKYISRFVSTPAFQKKNAAIVQLPLEECYRYEFKSDDYWSCYLQYIASTDYHPVGTAKMGPASDNTSVVNPRLKVKGVNNLRVVDASIMPLIPSANTNGPTLMIAEKAADIIKEDWLKCKNLAKI